MPPSLTRDCDLCWPFWGAIKHALLHCLHLLSMCQFALTEHISDQVKDLWLVPLPDFHAILHCHDEILGAVFSSMLRALLCCSCAPESTQCSSETDKHKIMFHWIWTAGSKPWVTLHMMAVAIDFYSRKPPISTYTEENLDHSELGGIMEGECLDSSITRDRVSLLTTGLSIISLQLRKTQKQCSFFKNGHQRAPSSHHLALNK